jgi:hypothetical protein
VRSSAGRLAAVAGAGTVKLQSCRLHLPGRRRADGGTAAQKNQVPVVGHGGLPFLQTHAVCTLGEVVARLTRGEAAVAAPGHVAPPVDDEGKSSQTDPSPRGRSAGILSR